MTQNLALASPVIDLVEKIDQKAENLRIPPHNYEAEQALLGALLHNNKAYEQVSEYLLPQHFSHAAHGKIYQAMGMLIERGQIADPITLKDFFQQEQTLTEIGGTEFLAHLAASLVSVINVKDYGNLIHDLALRRQLINLGETVINEAHSSRLNLSAQELIESTEQSLYDLATAGETEKGFMEFAQALTLSIKSAELAYKRDSHIVGVTSGLKDLDKQLGGFHPSDLLILAGRPSMGKTALATNIAFNAACAHVEKKEGAVVAFFSLEMSAEQLATRLLGQEAGIPPDSIRKGHMKKEDFPKLIEVSRRLSSIPLYIDDTPALTISALRTRARRLKRQHNLGMVVIDYLQLLHPAPGSRSENRVQEISHMTRGLKALAKELNVPVIALSQLSRAVEQREDKRPQLADLRESGTIEQDADVVMFVYREEYYLTRLEPPEGTDKHLEWSVKIDKARGLAEIIIAKQRHGPVGMIKLGYGITKFTDYMPEDRLPDVSR